MIISYKIPRKIQPKIILEWCRKNAQGSYELVDGAWDKFIFFENDDDATLVKVAFGEQKWDSE